MKKYINYIDLKNELLKDKEIKQGYDALEPEFAIIRAIIRKRIKDGLTQKQLAKKARTQQPVISRFERGDFEPSLQFLHKVAKALDLKIKVSVS